MDSGFDSVDSWTTPYVDDRRLPVVCTGFTAAPMDWGAQEMQDMALDFLDPAPWCTWRRVFHQKQGSGMVVDSPRGSRVVPVVLFFSR